MLSMLGDIGSSLKSFFIQLTSALGFNLLFVIALLVELFFVFLFVLRSIYSYEARLRRGMDKANSWLFKNKKIDQSNIKEFNEIIKKGPRRLVYFWQQFILYREKEPTYYLSLDNLVEKPLKTSSFANNIKNLNLVTIIWTAVTLLLGVSYQASVSGSAMRIEELIVALIVPVLVLFIGIIASIIMKARKTANLDEIYNIYHIFARFMNNACVDLPPYIDYDLLFTTKEIERGNPQLREYYEARARKAKEEFEKAKQSDVEYVEYNFQDAGVDGSLVLERAMKESEAFMNKKSSTLAKIAHVEAQKEALKRNYENVQKDLQRKIQASKENIQKLIQQQEATTNRMEVGFLRKQQEQEISKQESLQTEYDQEETRYAVSNEELNQEIAELQGQLDGAKENVQKAMVAEYQSFYEKIMNNAYETAEKRVSNEKSELKKERDLNEKELIIVQTQVKRLIDENNTLRQRLNSNLPEEEKVDEHAKAEQAPKGEYDANGNFVYEDGSYHDPNGLFHDIDGKIYDMNGTLIREPEDDMLEQPAQVEEVKPEEAKVEPPKGMKVEEYNPEEELVSKPVEEVKVEEPKKEVEKTQTQDSAKRGRGRPKKVVTEVEEPKEPKKRGRPRKDETLAVYSEKNGAPRTTSTAKKSTTSTGTKKRPVSRVKKTPAKSDDLDLVSLAKINKLITEEEDRLSKMKALVNSEITDALNTNEQKEINEERDEIMKAVEQLRAKAEEAKEEGKSEQELASINSRLEALIKEISELNKK